MPQTVEPIRDNMPIAHSLMPRGISSDSRELSKSRTRSFEGFCSSSEVLRRYSPEFMLDLEGIVEWLATREALNNTLTKVYNLLTWNDGWNGYDAPAPRYSAVMHAASWIIRFFFLVAGSDWISPNVTGGPEGEVVLEWWYDTRKLTVYISGQSAEYVQVWGTDINTDMSDGDAEPINVCQLLWSWLKRG